MHINIKWERKKSSKYDEELADKTCTHRALEVPWFWVDSMPEIVVKGHKKAIIGVHFTVMQSVIPAVRYNNYYKKQKPLKLCWLHCNCIIRASKRAKKTLTRDYIWDIWEEVGNGRSSRAWFPRCSGPGIWGSQIRGSRGRSYPLMPLPSMRLPPWELPWWSSAQYALQR